MKIALLGYGKMGKVIEKIALDRGHQVVFRKTSSDSFDGLAQADVAIDFSVPDAAVANISACLERGIPIVSGTTGWLASYDAMVSLCREKNGAFIYGSNFSLGVNLFFELNDHLAKMMSKFTQYKASMQEIHHTQKLDKPSGTAISLANGIIGNSAYERWVLSDPKAAEIEIEALRVDEVPGTHTVRYDSAIDTIEITHTAHSREGFAFGAVIAAEWIAGKKGVFTMKDVLGL
ncbi:4-hydroxy-tetrahydrodipicolinate reductase [Flavobacterium magnum]|uniref:4-hydroxy-tetrahydrodipicolinate reductase n=1 Tax=Flavobacterium magnum TaxID=2162713 RepID=A0A2S0RFU4_9FLAO|nr:4-hydroxy-tetrahydrodipicolinate reductase [Flavobacterium magnum]AWA29961.1 4-hydroxy-tetrahydrodipicolinate reductase [Flavobacterium magnum]